jgi:hypothetical protein
MTTGLVRVEAVSIVVEKQENILIGLTRNGHLHHLLFCCGFLWAYPL